MKDVDLQYEPKSFAGSFVPGELKEFEGWFRESSKKRKGFAFDPSYVAHVKKYNGGIPGKPYFRTAKGTPHVVERFLNFADMKNSGVLAEYHVGAVWTSIEERLGAYLVPFAVLFSGDFLCFDYEAGGRPKVVVWFHEKSPPDEPVRRTSLPDRNNRLKSRVIRPD